MALRLRGLCLLILMSSQPGLAQEESAQASDNALELERQALQREEIGPSVGADDLAAAGNGSENPVMASDVRRRSSGNRVMDEMDLGRTEITGNQELPTVMYIVPWKKSDPGALLGRPVNSLLEEVLEPIDRTEFIRRVDYYDDLYKTEED